MSETLENKPPRDVTLARLFGLVFALFVVFHVVETSTVVFGRDAFLGRLAAVIPPWARLIVLAPLAFHARLLFSLVGGTGRYVDAGVRKLQRLSALAVLAFLVLHLGHALVPALTLPPAAAYEMLRHELSMPIYFAIYVVGITATCLHLAQGLEAVSSGLGAGRARVMRAFGFMAALALFAVAMNTLSHFATGRAFVAPAYPR